MTNDWASVPLANVLVQDVSYVTQLEPRLYPKLSVRLYGRGVVLDSPTNGSTVKMARHQIAKPGQVILSEIWAKKGAIGIVPPEGAGALVTSHFFLFDIDERRVLRYYLDWMFRGNHFADVLDSQAHGTTGYAAIRPKQFFAIKIPLPSLTEQQRIVARIEALARLVEEARGLRRAATKEIGGLLRSILFRHPETALTTVSDLVTLREPNVLVQPQETYEFAGVYSFGRGVFRSGRKLGMDFSYKRLTRLKAGNFVYPKLMAWEGALGIVPPECDGLVVSTEFPVFEVDEDRVLSETLDVYFRSPNIWPTLSAGSTGTNLRRRRLNPRDFLRLKISVPPWAAQFKLRDVNLKCKDLHALHGATEKKLDALMPSILAKAFARRS
jgi:type I restriction enzyme, S subunit